MENNENMNRPVDSANAPVSRNWLPIIIIVAIVAIGLVAWGMSRDNDGDTDMAGNDNMAAMNEDRTTDEHTGNDGNVTNSGEENNEEDKMGVGDGMNAAPEHSVPSGTMIPEIREENGVKVVTVVGGNFYFGPGEIRVKKGDKVKIVFDNKEGFHDFVLDEFNAKTKQAQGPDIQEVTFTADKVGTFEYYCSVGKHRAMGMKGNFIVE